MIYRKRGAVARWENGTLIRVTESGVAIEEGEYFECGPMETAAVSEADAGGPLVRAAVGRLRGLPFERLIVTHGVAEHECEGRRWREETDRIHVSLASGTLRALVDAAIASDEMFTIAGALQRAEPAERPAPQRLALAPNVTAALLPHLVGRTPPNVRLVQTAGGVDGYGNAIVEAEGDWPNAYRPSYRVRPVRMPLNLRLECADTAVDEDAPRAIALLAPIAGLTMRVLVVDRNLVYPATVAVGRIRAVSSERVWYPYGGGSFGAALML